MDDGDAARDYPNPLTSLVNRRIGGDREVTYLLVAGVFFIIAAACYARILVIGMRTRSRTDAETQDTPPPPRTEQPGIHPRSDRRFREITPRTGKTAPRDERIPSILSWIGLSFTVPLGIMLRFGAMSGAEKIAWPMLGSFIMYFTTFPLLLLGFVFLVYPKDQPPFLQAKVPFIGFWIMATLAMVVWMFPRIAIIHATDAQIEAFDRITMSLAVIALGFWLWLLGTGGALRSDRTPPD